MFFIKVREEVQLQASTYDDLKKVVRRYIRNKTGWMVKVTNVFATNDRTFTFKDNEKVYKPYIVTHNGKILNYESLVGLENNKVYRFYTGYKIHRYGGFRYPKTTAELRAIANVNVEDGEPPFRASRTSIPTAWDDQHKQFDRCWKSYRRHQWKK